MRKTLLCVLCALALCLCASCAGEDISVGTGEASGQEEKTNGSIVVITVKDFGEIRAELCPEHAPITVRNFKKLVSEGYYDGTSFHRVINGFMIQGGSGAAADTIKGEFKANGITNTLKHERGVLSMARAKAYNSASSQFFICHSTEGCRHLDGNYAAFGRVLSGMEVVDAIAAVQTDNNDKPLTPVIIESIRFA